MTDERGLYKTTVVIWLRYPGDKVELVRLAQEATDGDAYCAKQESAFLSDPFSDTEAPSQEFFVEMLEWEEFLEQVIALSGPLQLTRPEAVLVANDLAAADRNRFADNLTADEVLACVADLGVRSQVANDLTAADE